MFSIRQDQLPIIASESDRKVQKYLGWLRFTSFNKASAKSNKNCSLIDNIFHSIQKVKKLNFKFDNRDLCPKLNEGI